MDLLEVIKTLAIAKKTVEQSVLETCFQELRFQPELVIFANKTLSEHSIESLIYQLCLLSDYNAMPSSGKALVMQLWTFVRRQLCTFSVHCPTKHALLDASLVELIYSHILRSTVSSSWVRQIIQWIKLLHKQEEDILAIAYDSIDQVLDSIQQANLEVLQSHLITFSPFITLPHLHGWNMLHYVCSVTNITHRMKEMITMLVNAGIDVNSQDYDGNTPLHIAVQYLNYPAIITLCAIPYISKSIENQHHQNAFVHLCKTLSLCQSSQVITHERLVTIIKMVIPHHDPAFLWKINKSFEVEQDSSSSSDGKASSRRRKSTYRDCCLYQIVCSTHVDVVKDILVYSTPAVLEIKHYYTICQMMARCVKIKKNQLLLPLWNMLVQGNVWRLASSHNSTNTAPSSSSGASNVDENNESDTDDVVDNTAIAALKALMEYWKLLNTLMILAVMHHNHEAKKLLVDLIFIHCIEQYRMVDVEDAPMQGNQQSRYIQYLWEYVFLHDSNLWMDMNSLFYWLVWSDDDVVLNNLFRALPRYVVRQLLLHRYYPAVAEVDSGKRQQLLKTLNEEYRGVSENGFTLQTLFEDSSSNVMNVMKQWSEIPLLSLLCMRYQNIFVYVPTTVNMLQGIIDQNSPGSLLSNTKAIANMPTNNSANTGAMLEMFFRKFFAISKELQYQSAMEQVYQHAILSSMVSGNVKVIDMWRTFLGPEQFNQYVFLPIANVDRSNQWTVMQQFWTIVKQHHYSFLFQASSSSQGNIPVLSAVQVKHLMKCIFNNLSIPKMTCTHSVSDIVWITKKQKVTKLISNLLQKKYQQLVKLLTLIPDISADPKTLLNLIQDISNQDTQANQIRQFYIEHQLQWKRLQANLLEEKLNLGFRKLSRKFPVDTKWLKVSYFFSAFYHFIVGSKAREESTRSFGVDKTAWDAFQKILAVALRSRQIFYEWIAKLLIPSNMSQHNFWKDFFAVDANVTAWKVYLERYRDPYLKVILPSSTTATSKSKDTGGSGGLIEVDLETLRRNDRDVCFVYKTIQEYLDLVVREGEQYLQILTNKLSGNNSGNPTMIHLPPTQAFLRTSINYQSYYEALTWSQDYDKLYFYNLSNPSSKGPTQHGGSLLSYVFPSCTDSPMSPTTRLTEELIINLQQLSQTNELVTKLPVPAMSKEISKFALNGAEDHSMIHSMFYKCRDITYREYFEQGLLELIEHNEAVGYQSYDLLAYVLPLCALQCYRAATKILQLLSHVNSSASASKDAASTKFKSVDAFLQANHAMIPMHVLYFYMPYDVKLHTLEQTVKQSIDVLSSSHHAFEHQCFENDEAMKILEVTPLTLAIFHQQPDFIALFLEVFPIFNFDINALFMLTMELQLFDAFAGLLSHLTCFKCEAILPFSHHAPYHIMSKEENNKYTQEGLDLYSNPHLQLPHGRYSHEYKHKYQLANRNFCLQSIQYLHQLIQSQQEAGSMPQAYAYLDMRLVCSYVLESTHTSPSGSLRSLDAKRVVLMDGTILPVAMVIDNVYNLFRALPQPCLRPGYTRALQTTLLHLAAQHSDLDFISRLLKNSSSTAPSGTSQSKQWWMIFIEVSDRVGKTPLTYLMEAGHYSFVQELLLRYSEQDSSVSSSLAATSGMAVTKNSCLYPQLHDLDHLAMVWNHAKLQDLQATQHRLQIPDEAGAQIDSNKQYLHSFASLLRAQPRAIQINSSLMKLSICLQYSQYLWNTIIVQRDFMRFVQYSVSSSFWSKMDSMVRARQVLSLLNIPFSYLTNTTTKKEAMFDFHPTALYQRIPVALYQQLKILLSGWFRMRCLSSKSTSTAASNSRQHCNTMLLEDCLFQHHVETSNCVSFGMSGLSIDDYLHVMTTTNKAKKTTKGSSAHPTAQVADIIKLEMLSNRENTPIASSSNMFSNNIVDTASKSFDIIYDALQSAYLILEFARSIVQCRTLAIVTYEAKGIAGATRSSDASKGIVANKAESSNPSQYVQIRYADHPLQHQHNQYLHYQQQLTYLQQRVQGSISSESNQGDMKKGLQQRMLFCDFIKIPELKTFLTLPTCYSCICSSSSSSSSHDSNNTSKNRLSIIRDLVMDGLINLLYDVDQASYGELICRLHLLSSSTTSTTGTGTSGGNTALAEMLLQPNSSTTANGTLGHKGARLSDSEDVLTSLLTLLQSFTIADFWCCTNSKGTKSGSAEEKRFPHFMSKFGASSIKQGGNLLISMIQSLKKGDVLTIAAEEETYLNKLFRDQATGNTTAAGNMTMKLTPQRREQMLQDTMQALSTAYKLCSYFYWMLTSIYGLIHHSTSSEEVMASGHLPLYSSTLYDEDVACGKSQALHPLLLLSTPVLKFWTRDNTLTKVHHNRQRQHHMFHVQRKLAMQSILKLRHNPNIYPNKAIVKQALDIAILSGDYMFANELLAGKQVKDLLSDVSIHFKYLLLAALLQCPSYTFLHKTGKEESYHKRVTCIQCVQLLLDHHFPTAFPDTSVAPMMSTVWCFLIAAWKNMPMDVLDRLWIRVVKEAERQNDQSEIVARFLMVALALISVNHHVQDRVLSKPSHTTTSRSYVKQEERQQLIKRIVEFIHQCGHKSIRTSVGSVLTYSLAHMTLLQSLQSQLQQLVCGVFAHLEQHQITGINANDLVLDLKQDLKAAIETCLTLSLPSRPVIGNLTYEVVNVATDSPTQKILTKHLLSTFLCPIQYDLLQLLLALNSTAKSRDSSMPSMDVSESMWSMLDLCIVLKDSTSLLTNLHHTFPFDKMKVVIQFLFASNEEQPRQDDDDDNNAVSLEAVNALQRLIAQCIIYQELSCLKAIHQFILSFGKASNTSVKITSSMAEELWSYLLHTELTLHKVGFNASNAFSVTMNILDFLLINTNPQSLHIATYLLDSGLNVTSMNFVKMICGNQVLHRNEEDHRGLNIASEATIVFFLNYYLKKKSSDEVNQLREELAFTTSLYDRDSGIDYLENHDTLLHILCRKGYSKLVRVWCEEIMIDLYRNPQIKPILMRQSSSSQHIDASALLGRNQVNILELKNDLDEDPLQVSITWGHSEVTKTLKSYCPPNIFKAIAYMRYLMHLVLLNRKKLKGKLEVVRKKQQEEEAAKQAKEEFRIRGEGEDEDEEYLEQRNKYLYGSFNDGNDEDNDD